MTSFFSVLYASEKPLFFFNPLFQYFGGENLELLNAQNNFDSYSFVQYIFDFGTFYPKHFSRYSQDLLSLAVTFRIKGNFGNDGRYNTHTSLPVKIGWAGTESGITYNSDTVSFWTREASIAYQPESYPSPLLTLGFFPFKIGNGLVLGNAYKLNEPIPGQYIYEQIDQFRPGILCSALNKNHTVKGDLYLGIIATKADCFANTALFTNFQNLETPRKERGPGKNTIVFASQINFSGRVREKKITLNPYLFLNNDNNQMVEFAGDATSTLITPGLWASLEHKGIRFSFEVAKNCGHQSVKKWDRNQLLEASSLYNSQLFYVANPNIPLSQVTNADFTFSPLVIRPSSIAQGYGNGTNFLYKPNSQTFIFKNSYDRFRNAYKNNYDGWLIYADLTLKEKIYTWAFATGFASGDRDPNDSIDTLLMTRLTPGITYLDYTKTYKGFMSVNQLFENCSINPLYFGQAQKLNRPLSNTGKLTTALFTNQGFIGSTIKIDYEMVEKKLHSDATVVTYFQLTHLTKGLSASLWDAQSLNFTNKMQTDMKLLLPNYLGTEFNASISYSPCKDINCSLTTALFFPGSYYNKAAGKSLSLTDQIKLNVMNFSPDEDTPITIGNNCCFYINAQIVCLFDFCNLNPFKKHTKTENL